MLVGNSTAIQKVLGMLSKIAKSRIPVMLTGETGTGKNIIAREIHKLSGANGSFVEVNCATLQKELAESILFGHVKGSFTGAFRNSKGLVAEAEGGTLFLDEVGDLEPHVQVKILNLTQSNIYHVLGSTSALRANFRLISATNRDLQNLRNEKSFREDLYYRIATVHIDVPPLRERRCDIPPLIEHFARLANKSFSTDAITYLSSLSWPGNVRHLENFIQLICLLNSEDVITLEMIKAHTDSTIFRNEGLTTESNGNNGLKKEISYLLKENELDYKKTKDIIVSTFENLFKNEMVSLKNSGETFSDLSKKAGINRKHLRYILEKLEK